MSKDARKSKQPIEFHCKTNYIHLNFISDVMPHPVLHSKEFTEVYSQISMCIISSLITLRCMDIFNPSSFHEFQFCKTFPF